MAGGRGGGARLARRARAGAAWSELSAGRGFGSVGYSSFEASGTTTGGRIVVRPSYALQPHGTQDVAFQVRIPDSFPVRGSLCARAFAGLGQDPVLQPVGLSELFCLYRESEKDGRVSLSFPVEAAAQH